MPILRSARRRGCRMARKAFGDGLQETDVDIVPHPFVKWAGGKRCLIKDLAAHLPDTFGDYYEPFVGGGALFFFLSGRIKKAYLSDTNHDLVCAYNAVKKNPYRLIDLLQKHAGNHAKEYYYTVRSQHDLTDPVEIAARFIYLNKTCYNGLYRVNRAGRFNVPMGNYNNPNIVSEENIVACHEALKIARIEQKEFHQVHPHENDFIYFDPPYHPTGEASFTSYTKENFTAFDQVRLKDFALDLHGKGVLVLLSNSHTEFIRDTYRDTPFSTVIVNAPRYVNCRSDGRSAVEEVLIRNY